MKLSDSPAAVNSPFKAQATAIDIHCNHTAWNIVEKALEADCKSEYLPLPPKGVPNGRDRRNGKKLII